MVLFHQRLKFQIKRGEKYFFEFLSPPISRKSPSVQDVFRNSIDRVRVREALLDEGCDLSSFPPVLNVPRLVFATFPKCRNPFQSLQHFPATSPAPERMNSQLAANSIGWKFEQSPLLINETPNEHSCINKKLGPTESNQIPINLAAVNLSRERKKGKSPLINIMQNYDFSSKVINENNFPSNQRQFSNLASTAPSPSVYGFCNKTNSSQGDKSLQVQASKILKHYSRKHTSFNNLWTALLKSELNGGCDINIPSISANNPDLWRFAAPEFRLLIVFPGQQTHALLSSISNTQNPLILTLKLICCEALLVVPPLTNRPPKPWSLHLV